MAVVPFVLLLVSVLAAWGIAHYWSRGESPPRGRFLARFLGAWLVAILVLAVLVYVVFALAFTGVI